MVSPLSNLTTGATGIPVQGRGFIPEETIVAVGPGDTAVTTYYRPFWRPVVAGAVFALSVFTLSWYLMLGCHVGIDRSGIIDLGAGAAVWMWVTACIAFFFGAMIASSMTMPTSFSWLKGAVIWALSIPMAMVFYGLLSQGAMALGALYLPHAGMWVNATGTSAVMATAPYGFFWSMFIGLALGLIFSIVGSTAGCACRKA